jgi:type I restriction enzyme R subunit
MSLLELIVKTGIANAIATQLGGLKGNRNAIAEIIENNVRRKIIKEQLSDPAYYEKMSALLDEIIAARKAKAIEYEEYLKRIAALVQRVEEGVAEDTPEQLKRSPGLRALYNNLKKAGGTPQRADLVAEAPGEYAVSGDPGLKLALKIDAAVKRVRPDGWRGVQAREQIIKAALYKILKDEAEVERIFLIIKAQSEY